MYCQLRHFICLCVFFIHCNVLHCIMSYFILYTYIKTNGIFFSTSTDVMYYHGPINRDVRVQIHKQFAWMHWKAHLFGHFRLFQTFSHGHSHVTPLIKNIWISFNSIHLFNHSLKTHDNIFNQMQNKYMKGYTDPLGSKAWKWGPNTNSYINLYNCYNQLQKNNLTYSPTLMI